MRGRPTSRLGRGLAARSRSVCGLRVHDDTRASHDYSAVAGLPRARRWLAGGEVHPDSTNEALG
jgi:hypothetical protein